MVVNVALVAAALLGRVPLRLGLLDGLGHVWVGCAVFDGLLAGSLIRGLRLFDTGAIRLAEGIPDDSKQIFLEKLRHLTGLRMHDAIEAEVQVGLVELEQLLQQADQAFSLFLDVRHLMGFSCVLLLTRPPSGRRRALVC